MEFEIQIDVIDLLIKGMLIGIVASAPMGPVGVLTVRRTLNKGRWFGLVTGLGAAASDLIYAAITGYGMSFVMDFISSPTMKFLLQVAGSVMLLIFGVISFRSNPTERVHPQGNSKGTLVHNGITGFLITISNPLIIILFAALFAQFAFVAPEHPIEMILGFASIFGGAMLWWYGLTWLVDIIRDKFSTDGIVIINRVIGSIVVLFSVIVLVGTVFNLYTIHL